MIIGWWIGEEIEATVALYSVMLAPDGSLFQHSFTASNLLYVAGWPLKQRPAGSQVDALAKAPAPFHASA